MPRSRLRPHPQAVERALRALYHLGYDRDLVEFDYQVWSGTGRIRADLVAFGRAEPKDMTTAALVVEIATEGYNRDQAWQHAAALGRTLAAPVVGIADEVALHLATVAVDGSTRRLIELPYDEPGFTSSIVEELGPRFLLEMKTGSRRPGLFPIDVALLEAARQESEDKLTPRVERALSAALEYLGYRATPGQSKDELNRSHQQAARLVVGGLTALVLRDNQGLEGLAAGALVDTILQRHPSEFRWIQSLGRSELDGLTGVIAGLGEDVTFRGLDPVILSSVYEGALVTDAARRHLGTHYTPPGLARRMLAELPVEEIEPGDRSILDPTCGSGGLLLAAHDRLRALQPSGWNLTESHRDLAEHLTGFDTDAFAVEIARLSLFLHAHPAGNGWDIRHADALQVQLPPSLRPSIIVANPPWRRLIRDNKRVEQADPFLHWMLQNLRAEGFLAVVLPAGWLSNQMSEGAREALRQNCDIFEIWRLPKGTFDSASLAPAVLFAQKKGRNQRRSQALLFRRVIRRSQLPKFYTADSESESFLASEEQVPTRGPLLTGPLISKFLGSQGPTLASVASVVAGPQPKPGFRNRRSGDCFYLPQLTNLPAFAKIDDKRLIRVHFPRDFQTARGAAGLGQRKVVVPAASGPDTPWRLRTALDLHGALVRNTMHMVLPKDDDDTLLYGLHAFLGSGFASCWIDELSPERHVKTSSLLSMPIPAREEVWRELADIGAVLVEVAGDPNEVGPLTSALDDLVWAGLSITDELRSRLIRRLAQGVSPEKTTRATATYSSPPQNPSGVSRSRFGVINDVSGGKVLIEIPGITPEGGTWMEPPPGLPAWLCQKDATFDVLIRDGDAPEAGNYSYQSESWVDDERLFNDPAYH